MADATATDQARDTAISAPIHRFVLQAGRPADLGRWIGQRDRIYTQIMEHGWNPQRRAFTQHDQTEVLDASLLMMPLVGFVAPGDPMWLQTLDAMDGELVSDSLVYRYDPSASPGWGLLSGRTWARAVGITLAVLRKESARSLVPQRIGALMLRTTNPQPSLWEAILPDACLGLPAELARVDTLLDDPSFLAPLAAHFDPCIGRPSVPLDTYPRIMS